VNEPPVSAPEARGGWDRAQVAAACLAVAPAALGGACLQGGAGGARDLWLQQLRALLDDDVPWRRLPANIDDERLLGGIDLGATLRAGRAIRQPGLLQDVHGGIVQIGMAERLQPALVARITAVLDSGEVCAERSGFSVQTPARFAAIALDESLPDEEPASRALLDRLAFIVDLRGVGLQSLDDALPWDRDTVRRARVAFESVSCADGALESFCAAAHALGIDSPRAVLHSLRVARILAALSGRDSVDSQDLGVAAALVFAPRATRVPAPTEEASPAESSAEDRERAEPPTQQSPARESPAQQASDQQSEAQQPPAQTSAAPAAAADSSPAAMEDIVLDAARAAIPAGLLAVLSQSAASRGPGRGSGRAGLLRASKRRGRPDGVRAGLPRAGQRLSVFDTLRAAAPWQRLRRGDSAAASATGPRFLVRREDFQVRHYQDRTETTTVFLIDASGSSALHRLAEAKGAVELLLADCYVRRDRVAVIAFRGRSAEVLLAPTRSLLRARRGLAALPGGGPTPLAAGLDAGLSMAMQIRRDGRAPTLIVLTDGRANCTYEGRIDRDTATREALAAARRWRGAGLWSVLVDTAPRPQAQALRLAQELGARYLPLPYADAMRIAEAAGPARGSRSRP